MSEPTAATLRLRAVLTLHRDRVGEVLDRYGATNPRLFGSVARGDAREGSDLDLLVDLVPGADNEMLRVSGLAEELSELLDVRVDVVTAPLLRDEVSTTALGDAVGVWVARTRTASRTSGPRSPVASPTATTSIPQNSARWLTTPCYATSLAPRLDNLG